MNSCNLSKLSPEFLKLNKALFWDVQFDELDLEIHARFIIARIVSRGNLADWALVKHIYGVKRIEQESMRIRSLDNKSLGFLSAYFAREKKEFRCCN
ncbi:MAG: hypothetical protein DSY80_09455 [Desulfocapsa sp.]|nr:MAG: hypothetical protein DSY80_09455 [Desulfocapsa sp.]